MSVKSKNTLMLITAVLLIITTCMTVYVAGNLSGQMPASQQINDMQQMTDNSQMGGNPPEMQENGSNQQTPPELSGNYSESENQNSQDFDKQQTEPQNNIDESSEKRPPDDISLPENKSANVSLIFCIILLGVQSFYFAAIVMYLILSKFNKLSFRKSMHGAKRITAFALCVIILTAALTAGNGAVINRFFGSGLTMLQSQEKAEENLSLQAKGASEITEELDLNGAFESSSADESALLVKDGGKLSLSNAKLTKIGNSSNTENSEFYGINSGILVTRNSAATIINSDILTSGNGSNAVFSTGENSKIYISDSTVKTTGNSSARGLDATYGGYIKADNVVISTQGGSCAALATDRGEGTVIANNSKLETNGSGSPLIYSTGDILITGTTGIANASQITVVEGKNSASVTNSILTASGAGNRNGVDSCGIMIYQSMSGDAGEGVGTFTASSSNLKIDENSEYYNSAPMFFVTNTSAVINLKSTQLSFGSGVLLSAKATGEWGISGSNGGSVTLNAENQQLSGNIVLDGLSALTMNMKNSKYSGTLNGDNSGAGVNLNLDKNSVFTLTGDSYVTSFSDEDSSYSNIIFNGYTLYVNGKAI